VIPLGGFRVRVMEVMEPVRCCIAPETKVGRAIKSLRETNCWVSPVVSGDGRIRGTVSLERLLSAVAEGVGLGRPVSCLMSPPVIVGPEASVEELSTQGITCAVVVEGGKPVGTVGPSSLMKAYSLQASELREVKVLAEVQTAIINAMYDGVYITDGSGYTIDVNDAYVRMTGIPREELVGRHMQDLVDSGYFDSSVSLMVLDQKRPLSIIDNIRGGVRCLTTGTPVFDSEGRIIRVVSCVRDMTDLAELNKRLAEAEERSKQYHEELEHLRRQQLRETLIAGQSEVMKSLFSQMRVASGVDVTVLIMGETGVGKELVAKEIHRMSPRRAGPFIGVNCAAIPGSLLESEMFGYEKGAFTGAKPGGKPGMFELARGGTIFLDEIGEMGIDVQAKLLRVLQEKEVTRVGGTHSRTLDVRIIAASNVNLEERVNKGLFREDLYYRLHVLPLVVPPLRERPEDIPVLVNHFLKRLNSKYGRNKRLDPLALERLMEYSWPGNVRELENLMERLMIVCPGDLVSAKELVGLLHGDSQAAPSPSQISYETEPNLERAVSELERRYISRALAEHGSTHKAARALGVSQPTVLRKARKYGIQTRDPENPPRSAKNRLGRTEP